MSVDIHHHFLKPLPPMTVGPDMFFVIYRSNNDINVLNQSLLFVDVIRGHLPTVNFTINKNKHNMRYYLIDNIYPS
jgi:hypothetical protein